MAKRKIVFTPKHIESWLADPSINPKTGKKIKNQGPTYMLLHAANEKMKTKLLTLKMPSPVKVRSPSPVKADTYSPNVFSHVETLKVRSPSPVKVRTPTPSYKTPKLVKTPTPSHKTPTPAYKTPKTYRLLPRDRLAPLSPSAYAVLRKKTPTPMKKYTPRLIPNRLAPLSPSAYAIKTRVKTPAPTRFKTPTPIRIKTHVSQKIRLTPLSPSVYGAQPERRYN